MKYSGSLSEDESGSDEVLPWRPAEQMRGEDKQRVEPATGLVYTFRNEIGREGTLELLLVLKWIVLLGIRHASKKWDMNEELVCTG